MKKKNMREKLKKETKKVQGRKQNRKRNCRVLFMLACPIKDGQ